MDVPFRFERRGCRAVLEAAAALHQTLAEPHYAAATRVAARAHTELDRVRRQKKKSFTLWNSLCAYWQMSSLTFGVSTDGEGREDFNFCHPCHEPSFVHLKAHGLALLAAIARLCGVVMPKANSAAMASTHMV